MTDSAVRYFKPESTMFHRKVRARLEASFNKQAGFLAAGTATDWADYRYRCGQCRALMEAMEICDQTEKEEGN